MDEWGLSGNMAVDWFNFCRELCGELCQEYVIQKSKKQIGGDGKIAEIDESKFAKVKYGRGHPVKAGWVFVGIERERPENLFLVPVVERNAATLIPIIKEYVAPGMTIISDCWKAYSGLDRENFFYETVNHSLHFKVQSF
jgi:transposase-like protein